MIDQAINQVRCVLSRGCLMLCAAVLSACGSGSTSSPQVVPANRAPVASDVQVTTTQGLPVSGTLDATDPDGDSITFSIDNLTPNLSKGNIVLDDQATGAFTYTPLPQEIGDNSYTFNASDSELASNDATVSITVNPSALGVWTGKFTSAIGEESDATAIVAANGDTQFLVGSDLLFSGKLETTDTAVTGVLNVFTGVSQNQPGGSSDGNLSIDGTLEPGQSITGAYARPAETGSFTLSYDQLTHERAPELSDLAATWSGPTFTNSNLDLSFDADGGFSGSDTDGCQYTGSATVLSPVANVYIIEMDATACDTRSGHYSGLATVAQPHENPAIRCLACEMVFIFGVSTETHGLSGRLEM